MNPLFSIRKPVANCASVPLYRASLAPRRASLAPRPASLGLAIALLLAGTIIPGQAQVVGGRQLVKAQLVADTQHIEPGQKFLQTFVRARLQEGVVPA